MRRVYPVRTTRDRWKIPLFCEHKCDESCNILFLKDEEDDYVIVENPNYKNGKCLNNNTQTTPEVISNPTKKSKNKADEGFQR